MDYYILEEYKRITKPIQLNNYTNQHLKTFDDIVITESIKDNEKIVDYIKKRILFDTRHIFSDSIKEVLENEKGYINSRAVFITSKKDQFVYWEVKFEEIDCITIENKEKDNQIKLNKDKIKDYSIFKVQLNKIEYLIVRFDAAERIMRKFPLGIKFKLIENAN